MELILESDYKSKDQCKILKQCLVLLSGEGNTLIHFNGVRLLVSLVC